MNTEQYDELLHYLKLESVYYSRSILGGRNWKINVPAYERTSMFHIVVSGSCEVQLNDKLLQLNIGDVLFIPRAVGHLVMGHESAELEDLYSLPVQKISDLYETLELNTDENSKTILLCGVVKLDHPSGEMLIDDMPELIHVRRDKHLFNDLMEGIVSLIFKEAEGDFLGGESVITRLVDILMIQTIREWVLNGEEFHGKWLKALKDKKIGVALSCIHKHPEMPWTVELLGKEAGMSRTAFSKRFSELLDETPMNYLTSWRMNLAEQRIRNGERVDADFIEGLGYQSESSFRRAFKKLKGHTLSEITGA